jgi:hypothetical protein
MKSKEEILKEKYSAKVMNWEKVFKQNPSIIEAAYEAMEEYKNQGRFFTGDDIAVIQGAAYDEGYAAGLDEAGC